jgi:hypothetical protein
VVEDAKKSNSTRATPSKCMCVIFDLLLLHEDQSGCMVFSMKQQQGPPEDILLYKAPTTE